MRLLTAFTEGGLNSYQELALSLETLRNRNPTIVDLACGDGFLLRYLLPKILSLVENHRHRSLEAELAVARKRHTPNRESLFFKLVPRPCRWQAPPWDLVLSHMAFMAHAAGGTGGEGACPAC